MSLYVVFLAQTPARVAVKKLGAIIAGDEKFHVSGKEIYLFLPKGAANSKLSNNLFEKALAVRATTRNWNTVNKLYEMATE